MARSREVAHRSFGLWPDKVHERHNDGPANSYRRTKRSLCRCIGRWRQTTAPAARGAELGNRSTSGPREHRNDSNSCFRTVNWFAADDLDERADADLVSTVSIPFLAGGIGTLRAQVFSSKDDKDRGGIVLRITMENDASAFTPYARTLKTESKYTWQVMEKERHCLTHLKHPCKITKI